MPDVKDNIDPTFKSAPRPARGFLGAASEAARTVIKLVDDASSREYSWYGLIGPEHANEGKPTAPKL